MLNYELTVKALRMAHVKGSTQFACYPYFWNEPSYLHSQPQIITALDLVLVEEGRRLSWPGYIPRSYARPKTVTHPNTNRLIVWQPGIELTSTESQVWCPNHLTTELVYIELVSRCCLPLSALSSLVAFCPKRLLSTPNLQGPVPSKSHLGVYWSIVNFYGGSGRSRPLNAMWCILTVNLNSSGHGYEQTMDACDISYWTQIFSGAV